MRDDGCSMTEEERTLVSPQSTPSPRPNLRFLTPRRRGTAGLSFALACSRRGHVQDRLQRDRQPLGRDMRARRRRGGTSRHLGLVEEIMRMRRNSPWVLTRTPGRAHDAIFVNPLACEIARAGEVCSPRRSNRTRSLVRRAGRLRIDATDAAPGSRSRDSRTGTHPDART